MGGGEEEEWIVSGGRGPVVEWNIYQEVDLYIFTHRQYTVERWLDQMHRISI